MRFICVPQDGGGGGGTGDPAVNQDDLGVVGREATSESSKH